MCDEHANFKVARDLAFRRFDVIREVEAERDAALARAEAAEAAIERVRAEVEEVQREHLVMPPDALILADKVLDALAPVTEGGDDGSEN